MPRKASTDYYVSPLALFRIGHLLGDHRFDRFRSHFAAPADAMDLNGSRRGDDDHLVDSALAAGFQQQGNVEHDGAAALPPGAADEGDLFLAHHGMNDALQPAHGIGPADDRPAQGRAVNRVVAHGPRELRGNCRHRAAAAALHAVHGGIGVEDRHAEAAELGSGGGFAHADAAGQADDLHRRGMSSATKARSASSTSGSTPNQARNPGTAW